MAIPAFRDLKWAKTKMSSAQFSEISDKVLDEGQEMKVSGTYIDLVTGDEVSCSPGDKVPSNTRYVLRSHIEHLL